MKFTYSDAPQLFEQVKRVFRYDDGELIWIDPPKNHMDKLGKKAGSVGAKSYIVIGLNGRLYRRSHLVFLYHYGRLPHPMCDHINRNRQDDKIENLREADALLNARNHSRTSITPRYGGKNFQVRLGQIHIGTFKTRKEAENAYKVARAQAYGV